MSRKNKHNLRERIINESSVLNSPKTLTVEELSNKLNVDLKSIYFEAAQMNNERFCALINPIGVALKHTTIDFEAKPSKLVIYEHITDQDFM